MNIKRKSALVMLYNDKELKEIRNAKQALSDYYGKLLNKINQNSSVDELNEIMSDAQYATHHYNNLLNYEIERPHRREIKITGNKHWNADFQKVDDEYEFNWDEDFLENAENSIGGNGIITKPKVLKDMHAWRNPYGGEWQYASANYPLIRKDLPKAIKAVNQNPHYWLQDYNHDDNDYLVEDLDPSIVTDFLSGMKSLFEDKETVTDANF